MMDRQNMNQSAEDQKRADQPGRPIDRYSYNLGVIDCFCEMVSAGLKTLAMSHPCDAREERDSYEADVQRICGSYGIQYYPENEPFLTDLFPAKLNQGKCNYLFFRTGDVLRQYLELKERQRRLVESGHYTGEERRRLARDFGRLLSYPEEGIERYIQQNRGDENGKGAV